jgi:hypothetical protein
MGKVDYKFASILEGEVKQLLHFESFRNFNLLLSTLKSYLYPVKSGERIED